MYMNNGIFQDQLSSSNILLKWYSFIVQITAIYCYTALV